MDFPISRLFGHLLEKGEWKIQTSAGRVSESLVGRYVDPVDYAENVLKISSLTNDQKIALRRLNEPPYKQLVRSAHGIGKSFMAAIAVNWWFDTFDPSIVLTTAPSQRQVCDILWKEIRDQRMRAGLDGFAGPRVPRLESSPVHFAHGFTARDANRFQGNHGPHVLIVFDEAQGVEAGFWEAAFTQLDGVKCAFLAIYNPLGSGCRVFVEESQPGYHPLISLSCFDHPNIEAELRGDAVPVPPAIRLQTVRDLLQKWATPIDAPLATPNDVRFDGQWWQLGPIADARLAGRWPMQAVNTVWSKKLFRDVVDRRLIDGGELQIGCDCARFGDAFTAIHVRKGFSSLHHERHNGWSIVRTYERLVELAVEFSEKYRNDGYKPKAIKVAVDDVGVGGGVLDMGNAGGYRFVGVNAALSLEQFEEKYPNMRSALWFHLADAARDGNLSLHRLPRHILEILESQLLTQRYELDNRGRRVVWSKDKMRALMKQESPDDADALHLAYVNVNPLLDQVAGRVYVP